MPSPNGAYGTVSVGASATLIVGGRSRRESVIVQNNHASQTLFVGSDSSVTTSTGLKVAAGASVTLEYQGDVYGIASGAATTTNYWENY